MSLAIAVRYAGERTLDACLAELRKQTDAPIETIETAPFAKALRHTYEYGIESGADCLLTVDADVIPLPGLIDALVAHAQKHPDIVERHAIGQCALTLSKREIGPRLYVARFLPKLIQGIGTGKRPESEAIRTVGNGACVKKRLCLHDFGQWRRDLYRKGALYAKKHRHWLGKTLPDHPNYRAFARGTRDHGKYTVEQLLDRNQWPAYDRSEREPLHFPYDAAIETWLKTKMDTT